MTTSVSPECSRHSPTDVPLRVVIADGSKLYREILKLVLEALPMLEVLDTAGDGASALQAVSTSQPDLLLLDLHLPGINGLQTLALVREYYPGTRVVILSTDGSPELKATCLAQGAHGFVPKHRLYRELHGGLAAMLSPSSGSSADQDGL